MSEISVPFNDLHAQYLSIKPEIDEAISEVIANSAFVRGTAVDKFEEEFASELGVKHSVSCASGTDALFLAIVAMGLKPGDEVIAPAHSWISTTSTISQAGGTVVFCDTEKDTYTIDPSKIEAKITNKTVGIIPVHLYGQAADMDPIVALASKYNLWIIEDCAQAHLAKYKGKTVGTIGDVGAFSFYPGKNLGAMGDAGAAVTNDTDVANKIAMIARHGGLTKGDHQLEGINSRLDGMQAAILSVKLRYLDSWTESRKCIANTYSSRLKNAYNIKLPSVRNFNDHVYHLYVIKSEYRDRLAHYLKENKVQTVINYPISLPFLPAYQRLNHSPQDFPNAFANQSKVLSLPIYPEMPAYHVDKVISLVSGFKR